MAVKKGRTIRPARHQTGHTNKSIDRGRKALTPGYRISRTGKTYYEGRKNRSDMKGKTV